MYAHIHVDVFTYMWWLELDTVYLHHSLPYLWMCMCTCMYVCICVCTCEGQRSVLSVFLSHSSLHLCGYAMYMCVHAHVYVHTCIRGACTCMHVHVEMSWHHVSSSVTLQLTFWDRVSRWTWSSWTCYRGWPASSRNPSAFIFPSLGLQICAITQLLHRV